MFFSVETAIVLHVALAAAALYLISTSKSEFVRGFNVAALIFNAWAMTVRVGSIL